MKKIIIGVVIGVILGALIMGIVVWNVMPDKMLILRKSKYDFDETVARLEESIYANNWEVLHTYDIGECLYSQGLDDTYMRIHVFSFCQPEYSYNILLDDENKKISAIMPCRIAVYETVQGEVFLSRMNIGMMSQMFGGVIADIMKLAAEDDHKIVSELVD